VAIDRILGGFLADQVYSISVTVGSTTEVLPLALTLGTTYFPADDASPECLIEATAAALAAHSLITTVTFGIAADGRVTLGANVAFLINWTLPANTFPSWALGFDGVGLAVPSTSFISGNPSALYWRPGESQWDTKNRPDHIRAFTKSVSGRIFVTDFGEARATRELRWSLLQPAQVFNYLDRLNRFALSRGRLLRFYEGAALRGLYVAERLPRIDRSSGYPYRFDVRLNARVA
jgi:hypothetical protein